MLLGYIWLLGTFVNSSCDIKINVNVVQNSCRNLAVRGLIIGFALLVLKKRTETSNRMLTKFVSIGSYSPEVRTFGTLITSTKVFSLL